MKFQLFHVSDRALPKVAMGNGSEAQWPADYYHVADVEVETVDDVYKKCQRNNTQKNAGWDNKKNVFAFATNPRSTAPGDVVKCPDGKVIRFTMGENEEISK